MCPANPWELPSGAGWKKNISWAVHCTSCPNLHSSHSLPEPSRYSLSLSQVMSQQRCQAATVHSRSHYSDFLCPYLRNLVQRYAGKLNFQVLMKPSTPRARQGLRESCPWGLSHGKSRISLCYWDSHVAVVYICTGSLLPSSLSSLANIII